MFVLGNSSVPLDFGIISSSFERWIRTIYLQVRFYWNLLVFLIFLDGRFVTDPYHLQVDCIKTYPTQFWTVGAMIFSSCWHGLCYLSHYCLLWAPFKWGGVLDERYFVVLFYLGRYWRVAQVALIYKGSNSLWLFITL